MTELTVFDSGSVNISEEVIGVIASIATSEIKGVKSLSGTFSEEVLEKIGKKSFKKGIKIVLNDNLVIIELGVVLEYEGRIIETAQKIQRAVKTAVESMTGITVLEVKVLVTGVNFK